MILVDTCVWSEALRRSKRPESAVVIQFRKLIEENQASIIGPIRQELLSGIKDPKFFTLLKDKLHSFPDISILEHDYELAAEFYNRCQRAGVQGSNTDFLICAVSSRLNLPIFTTDKDFVRFQKVLKVELYNRP
ncbi:MAG: PIN domain nuclease [Bdellovibrionales bacterium CG10_big_fil_rev_8_21_14_0_10_45_34]|nr:MAG: PIN domain nuclease [Bdellovibrionales bacterium CG10_big_fil_rev_8_21_14_0_10_45_34]